MNTIDHQQAAVEAIAGGTIDNGSGGFTNLTRSDAENIIQAAAPHLRAAWEQENEQKLATIREWAERWAKHPDNPGAWAAGEAILALLEGGGE